jgi:hypothetical protein
MAIPVIDEAISLFTGFLYILPDPFKILLFLAVISLFVTITQVTFDTFGIAHPRIFQPVECASATPFNPLDVSQQIFYNGMLSSLDLNTCLDFIDCVNIRGYNLNCTTVQCNAVTVYGQPVLYTVGCRSNLVTSPDCCTNQINNATGNSIVYDCVNSTNLFNATVLEQYNLYQQCKNAGLDLLDSSLIWTFTIMYMLVSFAWWYYSNTIH